MTVPCKESETGANQQVSMKKSELSQQDTWIRYNMNSVRAWSSISFSKIMDIRSHPLNTLGNFSNCFTNILKPPTVVGVFHLAAIKEQLVVVQRISLPNRKTWSIITWKAWKNITTSLSQRDKPHQPAAMSWGPNPLSQSMQVAVGMNPLWNLT